MSLTDAIIVDWSGFEWYSITANSIFTLLFLVIGWYSENQFKVNYRPTHMTCLTAFLALVKSPEWMEMKKAMEGGRASEQSWVIFCMFDKGPLILLSGIAASLCTVSLVFWSLALVNQVD